MEKKRILIYLGVLTIFIFFLFITESYIIKLIKVSKWLTHVSEFFFFKIIDAWFFMVFLFNDNQSYRTIIIWLLSFPMFGSDGMHCLCRMYISNLEIEIANRNAPPPPTRFMSWYLLPYWCLSLQMFFIVNGAPLLLKIILHWAIGWPPWNNVTLWISNIYHMPCTCKYNTLK